MCSAFNKVRITNRGKYSTLNLWASDTISPCLVLRICCGLSLFTWCVNTSNCWPTKLKWQQWCWVTLTQPLLCKWCCATLPLQELSLRVTVAETTEDSRGENLGHVIIGPEASGMGITHWNQMLATLRKPVSMWHPLRRIWSVQLHLQRNAVSTSSPLVSPSTVEETVCVSMWACGVRVSTFGHVCPFFLFKERGMWEIHPLS